MAYNISVQIHGDTTQLEVDNWSSGESKIIETPHIIQIDKSVSNLNITWQYTPGEIDGIEGFLVYMGVDPVPNWSLAYDNGLSGGDLGFPIETYSVSLPNSSIGTIYIAIQSYSSGLLPKTSDIVGFLVLPSRPDLIRLDGVSSDTGRWTTSIQTTPMGDANPKLLLDGVEGLTGNISIVDYNGDIHDLQVECGLLTDHQITPS